MANVRCKHSFQTDLFAKIAIACIVLTTLGSLVPVRPIFAQGLVESCALADPGAGYCDNINDLVAQVITIGEFLLGLAGSLALLMFVYGGIVFVTSQGQAERTKKATQIIGAAVIGLIISLSAYIIVEFIVVDALGVTSYFRG